MKLKAVSGIMLTLLLTSMLTLAFNIQPVKAEPKTIYVDASNIGDLLEDGTVNHPFNKIQEGIDAANGGDTVLVAPGTYYENTNLKNDVRVQGAGADVTTIDGGRASSVITAIDIDFETVLEGFTITNGKGTQKGIYTYGGGIYVSNSSVVVRNCIITGNGASDGAGGIEAYDSTMSLYNNNISENNGWWGGAIALHRSNAEIMSNIIDNNDCGYGGAIFLTDSSQATFVNNQITESGVGIGIGESSTAVIMSNTICDNRVGIATNTYGVDFGEGSAIITNCILWGNSDDLVNLNATYSNIEDGDPGEGNICAYPMFVDAAGGDYHLKPRSPCIDAGTSEGAPVDDMEGNTRPIDGDGDGIAVVDMGAYEYSGPLPPPPPSEVWVDDDYVPGGFNDGHTWGYDAFDRIQDGVDAVAQPGTVYVAAGTYFENIWLRSGVVVQGAGPDSSTIDGGGSGSVVTASGVGSGAVLDGFTITNGTGKSGEGGGMYVSHSSLSVRNTAITGNTASGGGIKAYDSTISLYNNNITANYGHRSGGIFFHNSTADIMNNIFDNNECYYGGIIHMTDSSNSNISGNNITDTDTGISLCKSSNTTISQNNIENNRWGISLAWSSCNTFSGNNIENNIYGIFLSGPSNIVCGNNITASTYYGICLDRSSNNTIFGNNIANNNPGINVRDESSNNIIYHNNFINNRLQVQIHDELYNNIWDDGYPSGGNYWSDYTDVDLYSGPNQDQPSSDGIGDTAYVIDANNTDHYPLMYPWGTPPPPSYTLSIYSSPTGVTFTVDGVSRTTLWSGTYTEGTSVSLVMPEVHTVGDARYYWNQWSDGNTSRSRTVIMNTNITLTAYYTGPYYELTVTSSPITGIQFTINGAPKTTPNTEWLLEGSYTLIMSETHNGYVWSHWLEDGDTNRIKTITLPGTTWTAVYASVPVGGKATPINIPTNKPELQIPWIWLTTIILSLVLAGVYVKKRKRNTRTLPYVKC